MAIPYQNITQGLLALEKLTRLRLERHFSKSKKRRNTFSIPDITLPNAEEPLGRFVKYYQLSTEETYAVLAGLAPHVIPNFFDAVIAQFLPNGGDMPEFGGLKKEGNSHRGMLPTGETLLFLLAGNDIEKRLHYQWLLSHEHFLSKEKILYLDPVKSGEPLMSGKLVLDPEYVELFTTGGMSAPKMSTAFPAQYLFTELEWADLVLNAKTFDQIKELEDWVNHQSVLMNEWEMRKKLKPGYRALFYGPPGTGKTMTATLLGKYTNKPVFRIDLSMIISKYIGETEKNLASLFDKAQNKDWILFFDEADSIFGKRTKVRDAHDKYANQEVSYLLQRIENYNGLTILASNFKSNIDDAFMRRFHSVIYFPLPQPEERLQLWRQAFPHQVSFASDVDFQKIADQYELSGAGIMNVVQHCCIGALAGQQNTIHAGALIRGIAREYAKEGKVL